MCGLIMAKGYTEGQIRSAMSHMGYRGKDGKKGVSFRGGWALGHVRLAIQDLSDYSDQPLTGSDFSLAYVGELFGTSGRVELDLIHDTFDSQGPKGFQSMDGFWSIATIHNDGHAQAFTDYLGQKPLYVWEDKDIVCSEIEPMFLLQTPPEWDEVYFANVIKFGYDCTGRTPYQGIRQLAPGTVVHFTPRDEVFDYPYWSWDYVENISPAYFHRLFHKATMDRLVGDREVALLLSGGLDSSIIYYVLQDAGVAVKSFSIENGETEFLPEGVELLKTEPVDMLQALAAMQVPVDLGSMIPQYQLGLALKKAGFNVCLSGDGADELFGGYRRAMEYDSQASDVFMELPYYHLPRLDRVMMRHTVELRSPFLNPHIVKLALRLPYSQRTEKQFLKQVFKGVVPDRILERKKHPLKTTAVIEGGIQYRKQLVEIFKC